VGEAGEGAGGGVGERGDGVGQVGELLAPLCLLPLTTPDHLVLRMVRALYCFVCMCAELEMESTPTLPWSQTLLLWKKFWTWWPRGNQCRRTAQTPPASWNPEFGPSQVPQSARPELERIRTAAGSACCGEDFLLRVKTGGTVTILSRPVKWTQEDRNQQQQHTYEARDVFSGTRGMPAGT
jgi:hypothetical protein